jgi:hypothetical protein
MKVIVNNGNILLTELKVTVEFYERKEVENYSYFRPRRSFKSRYTSATVGAAYHAYLQQYFGMSFEAEYDDVKLYECEVSVKAGFKKRTSDTSYQKHTHMRKQFHNNASNGFYYKYDPALSDPLEKQIRNIFSYIQINEYYLNRCNKKLHNKDLRSIPNTIKVIVEDPVRAKRALVANYI